MISVFKLVRVNALEKIYTFSLFVIHWKMPGTSTRAFFKGIETWKKETIMKKARPPRFSLSPFLSSGHVLCLFIYWV